MDSGSLHGMSFLGLSLLLTGAPHRLDPENGLRCSVAPVADADDDGAPDFALARRGHGARGFLEQAAPVGPGAVWVFSSRDGHLVRTLETSEPTEDFGHILTDVGDVNGDGPRDLAVADSTRVWLFSGTDGTVLRVLGELGTRSCSVGNVAGGLDLDGDGGSDVAVLCSGFLVLYSGRSGDVIRVLGCTETLPRAGPVWHAPYTCLPGSALRSAFALLPDRDGDARAELAITRGTSLEIVSSGQWKPMLSISLPEGMVDHSFTPWIVRGFDDMDGDGVGELLLSVVNAAVLVYSGTTGAELRRHSFAGGYLNGEGTSLDGVGDIDGDGHEDYLVAANEDGLDCDPGFAIVYSGVDGSLVRHADLEYDLAGDCGVGFDACALGDTNGDSVCDVAVHMPRLREARVLSGKDFSAIVRVDLSALEPFARE